MERHDVETLVSLVSRTQHELLGTQDVTRFMALKEELLETLEQAKTALAHHEELANLWRGLELNLTMFQSRIRSAEADVIAAAAAAAPPPPPIPPTISDLIDSLTNEAQKLPLRRLMMRHAEDQLYLAGYEAASPGRGDVEGTFTVLGSVRKGTRESYNVKWYRLNAKPTSFWCSCPDHKFNSAKKNMMCKHICFLVARVARILDTGFFESKQFTAEQHAAFAAIVQNAAIFADGSRERERLATAAAGYAAAAAAATAGLEAARDTFRVCRKPVTAEDMCPICYDVMEDTECLNCPTCSNNVHRECMEVWLERNSTCVYCRSDVWRRWR